MRWPAVAATIETNGELGPGDTAVLALLKPSATERLRLFARLTMPLSSAKPQRPMRGVAAVVLRNSAIVPAVPNPLPTLTTRRASALLTALWKDVSSQSAFAPPPVASAMESPAMPPRPEIVTDAEGVAVPMPICAVSLSMTSASLNAAPSGETLMRKSSSP